MRRLSILVALGLFTVSGHAQATPIVYTFSGRISGSLDNETFSLSDFSLSLASDTDSVFQPRPDFRPSLYNSAPGILAFTVNGVSGRFSTLFNAFSVTLGSGSSSRSLVGLTEATQFGNDLIDVRDDRLVNYDLKSQIPSRENSPIDFVNFGTTFETSAGQLTFFDDDLASASFRATISAVPEPATWAMMIMGFSVIGAAMRRRPKVTISFA